MMAPQIHSPPSRHRGAYPRCWRPRHFCDRRGLRPRRRPGWPPWNVPVAVGLRKPMGNPLKIPLDMEVLIGKSWKEMGNVHNFPKLFLFTGGYILRIGCVCLWNISIFLADDEPKKCWFVVVFLEGVGLYYPKKKDGFGCVDTPEN